MTDRMTEQEIEALCADLRTSGLIVAQRHPFSATLHRQALTAIRQLQQPWRGMDDTAQNGEQVLLTWADGSVTFGRYDRKPYHKNPRPMFVGHYRGVQWMRDNQPIAWRPMPTPAPLPTPPETER